MAVLGIKAVLAGRGGRGVSLGFTRTLATAV
jgi:hypothetical protein